MSVRRRVNWVSQIRIEPHQLRSIESAVSSDFDELLATFAVGYGATYIVRGFELNMSGAIGSPANSLAVIASDSAVLHGTSTTSGTFHAVPVGTPVEVLNSISNTKVTGTFTPGTINYVALDFNRAADTSTSGPVTLRDVVAKTEIVKNLPLAQLMKYKFVINTSGFSSSTVPLFTVQTDASNNVVKITDRRDLLYRQGKSGFSTPNPFYKYPWIDGRVENSYESTSNSVNPFKGGDKQLTNLKTWMDAVTSSIQEVKGTPYWYSSNSGGSILKLRGDLANTIITSRGNVSHDNTTAGKVNWSHDIKMRLVSSRLTYKISAYATGANITLTDGQVAYIKIVRGQAVSPNLIWINGSPSVSSVGLTGWTSGLAAGDFIRIAGTTDEEYYEILSVDSPSGVTLTSNFTGTSTGALGIKSEYAWGTYSAVATPTTDRHIWIENRLDVDYSEDMFWMFFRDDNGGSTPKVYTRFKAGEIEQGESIEISDNTSEQLIQYMGATSESDSAPAYANVTTALVPFAIVNGDNLTLAISQLIGNINDIYDIFDQPSYDESYDVVAAAPGTGEILGPITAGTNITIPVNTRLGGSPQQQYVVGKGALEVYLNGQYLLANYTGGWFEVGAFGTNSIQIQIDQDIVVGDTLTFRMDATGGPGSGTGGSGVASINTLVGAVTLAAGSNVSITPSGNTLTIASTGGGGPAGDFNTLTETTTPANNDTLGIYDASLAAYRKMQRGNLLAYARNTVTVDTNLNYEHDVVLVDASAGPVTITLPDASLTAGYDGKRFDVKKIDSSANAVIIEDAGGNNIDFALTFTINTQGDSVTLIKDQPNSQYWMI